jgi:predicted dehydrogenase
VELNGSERSFVFITGEWNKLQTGKAGGSGLETITIPEKFWKVPGSPRDPRAGDPLVTFRYDQAWEFVEAIRNQRPCVPNFHDGARAQAVTDAAVKSAETKQWVEL